MNKVIAWFSCGAVGYDSVEAGEYGFCEEVVVL